jgi:hypothetical protein
MVAVRTLSDDEITRLVREHCGIDSTAWAEITKPFLVAESPDELRLVEWGYEARLRFLLEAARSMDHEIVH